MAMFVFLPWARVSEAMSFGEFELLPFERGASPACPGSGEQATFDRLLRPYCWSGDPIQTATLVRIGGTNLGSEFSESERTDLFAFAELLATAGLAARGLFGAGSYQNRENFRLVIQAFVQGRGGAAITSRRRDGSATHFMPEDSFQVEKPEHIPGGPTRLDQGLLNALLQARDREDWLEIYEAVLSFNLANTDSPDFPEQKELVFLVGAFERLLGCTSGKQHDFAPRFTSALSPTNDVAPSAFPEAARRPSFSKHATLREVWVRDLFRLRGELAHGKVQSGYQPIWSLRNHLLLGSFVFPLVLKSLLTSLRLYAPRTEDRDETNAFELLVCHDHFSAAPAGSSPLWYKWHHVHENARAMRRKSELASELVKNFPELFSKNGA